MRIGLVNSFECCEWTLTNWTGLWALLNLKTTALLRTSRPGFTWKDRRAMTILYLQRFAVALEEWTSKRQSTSSANITLNCDTFSYTDYADTPGFDRESKLKYSLVWSNFSTTRSGVELKLYNLRCVPTPPGGLTLNPALSVPSLIPIRIKR